MNTPLTKVIYIQKMENTDLVSVSKENYKTIIKEMTAEYPELSARIGSKGYNFKSISKTITSFNEWMLDNGEEMVLEMQ